MSMADSLIIAILQLVTVEVIWPLKPNASQSQLTWLARLSSLLAMIIALVTGIFWKSGVSALTAINFPERIVRLGRNNTATASMVTGNGGKQEAKPVNSGITGVMLNVLVSVLAEFLVFERARKKLKSDDNEESTLIPVQTPAWDVPNSKRFGKKMNFRSSYNAPNESIARRRSTLSLKLEAMGISTSPLDSGKALRNCELGLGLMNEMESIINKLRGSIDPNFRLFITALPHPDFPLGLLQMCSKVTNDPPAGLRAG
ncbi:hypothetical protein THAOC_00851, partial [Thalassiosira oceanica]